MNAVLQRPQPLRVLVVDDSRIARELLAASLEQIGGFEVVAVAAKGERQALKSYLASVLRA